MTRLGRRWPRTAQHRAARQSLHEFRKRERSGRRSNSPKWRLMRKPWTTS